MDVHGAGVKDNAALARHLHGFSRDHDNGAGEVIKAHVEELGDAAEVSERVICSAVKFVGEELLTDANFGGYVLLCEAILADELPDSRRSIAMRFD